MHRALICLLPLLVGLSACSGDDVEVELSTLDTGAGSTDGGAAPADGTAPPDGEGPPLGDEPIDCEDVPEEGTPCCGDAICDGPETADNCPADC